MSQTPNTAIAVIGIDIGKNSFHVVGHDARGAIVLRQKWSRGQVEAMTVPGIGPMISSAMVAAIGTGDVFSKGRDFGAWLGLVPKQISTGDRTILGKISRRGNRYLRSLFVQAAWVVLVRVGPKHWDRYGLKSWIEAAKKRLHHNVLAMRLPTSWPASPGPFSTRSANSSASGQTRCRPEPLECRSVLGPVKAWRGNAKARGKTSATASLDGPLRVARQHMRRPGRGNGPQARTKELHKDKERSMT